MSTIEWPTRERVRNALDEALVDDALTDGWRRVLAEIAHDLHRLIGLSPCMQLLHDQHDSLAGEAEPGAHDRAPGIHMGVYDAHNAVAGLWREWTWRYARRVQAALNAVADGVQPEFGRPLPGDEPPKAGQEPTAPDVEIPAALRDRDDLALIRAALAQLAEAEQAAEEEWELGEYEDEETGEIGHCIPEHQIEASHQLLDEAGRWDEYLGDYADALTYTLLTVLRDRLTAHAAALS